MSTLAELFTRHLRAPERSSGALVDALAAAGFAAESGALATWCARRTEYVESSGPWSGTPIHVAATPPAGAQPGALWFDVAALALAVQCGRAWLDTRPAMRWQMRAFLDVAPRAPREVQVAPPYRALDPERLVVGGELERVTSVTAGESTLFAIWFGKGLPHLYDWQAAQEAVPAARLRAMWSFGPKEWTSAKLDSDEAARVFVTPSTIDWSPDEVEEDELERPEAQRAMLRGEWTRDREIGFRTAVLLQTGLVTSVSRWQFLAEDVKLTALLDRSAFA